MVLSFDVLTNIKRSFACSALHWQALTPEEGLDQAKTS